MHKCTHTGGAVPVFTAKLSAIAREVSAVCPPEELNVFYDESQDITQTPHTRGDAHTLTLSLYCNLFVMDIALTQTCVESGECVTTCDSVSLQHITDVDTGEIETNEDSDRGTPKRLTHNITLRPTPDAQHHAIP